MELNFLNFNNLFARFSAPLTNLTDLEEAAVQKVTSEFYEAYQRAYNDYQRGQCCESVCSMLYNNMCTGGAIMLLARQPYSPEGRRRIAEYLDADVVFGMVLDHLQSEM